MSDETKTTQTLKPQHLHREELKANVEDANDAVNTLEEARDVLEVASDYISNQDYGEAAVSISQILDLLQPVLEFLGTQTQED